MPEIKRRSLLKLTAAGTASFCTAAPSSAQGVDYDVVIVGAGVAGMTAAKLLSKAGPGLKVLVLEARERVGGRLMSVTDQNGVEDLPSHGIELGAQFVHGSQADTWDLINSFELATRQLPEYETAHYLPPFTDVEPDWEAYSAVNARIRATYSDYAGPDVPYRSFVAAMDLNGIEREMAFNEALSWSAEPDDISARAVIEDGAAWDAWHDHDYQIIGGYSELARNMAMEISDRIQLGSVVTEVFWRPGLVGVSYDFKGIRTSLTCRQLILTVPIGVLKSGDLSIEPPLPPDIRTALAGLDMGSAVVVPMIFSKAFWEGSEPGYWLDPAGRRSFSSFHDSNMEAPALSGWFTGSAAQTLSALGPDAGLQQVIGWLEEASGRSGLRELLRWHAFKDWIKDPYTKGSYSFTRPGGADGREKLRLPVEDTLYLAGEATAVAPHYQTVHGAYQSGMRVAEQVASALNVEELKPEQQEESLFQLL